MSIEDQIADTLTETITEEVSAIVTDFMDNLFVDEEDD